MIWPGRVSFEEWLEDQPSPGSTQNHRDSWCYGVPGIARSIWLAGQAARNEEWIETGLRAYLDIEKGFTAKVDYLLLHCVMVLGDYCIWFNACTQILPTSS